MRRPFAILVVAGFALAACLVGPARAQEEPPPPALKKQVLRELGLNNDQIGKLEDLSYHADRAKLEIRHKLQMAHLDLQHLMSQDMPEQKVVFAKLEEISRLELQLKKNRVGLMLKIRKLLTREQWEKLELFQAERKARRRERKRERRRKRMRGAFDVPAPPEAPEAPPAP